MLKYFSSQNLLCHVQKLCKFFEKTLFPKFSKNSFPTCKFCALSDFDKAKTSPSFPSHLRLHDIPTDHHCNRCHFRSSFLFLWLNLMNWHWRFIQLDPVHAKMVYFMIVLGLHYKLVSRSIQRTWKRLIILYGVNSTYRLCNKCYNYAILLCLYIEAQRENHNEITLQLKILLITNCLPVTSVSQRSNNQTS